MHGWNLLAALFAPGAGHVRAGRPRRGLVWIAVIFASLPTLRWSPWLPLLVWLAHVVDAAVVSEGDAPGLLPSAGVGIVAWVLLGVGAVLTRSHWVEMFKIPSGSMAPTLLVGDHVAIDKTVHEPRRGDLVVYQNPRAQDTDFLKRVIAVGGDTVEIRDGVVYVNGRAIEQRAVDGECSYRDYSDASERWEERRCDAYDETLDGRTWRVFYEPGGARRSFAARTVPAGEYFFLGDNRDNSFDSRHYGAVAQRYIKGRLLYIWWSDQRGIHWPWQLQRVF